MLKNDYDAIVWAWGLLKKYHDVSDDPDYWAHLLSDMAEHDGDGVAWQQFAMAVGNILDARYKEMKK